MSLSSSSDQSRPPRRETKPMSLIGDDDVEEVADAVKKAPFNPDRWILDSPEINTLAEELVGKQSKAPDPEGKNWGSPMSAYNEMKSRGDAANALRQLISSATTVLAFSGDRRRKSYDHDVAKGYATKRLIRVLCDRIISLELKRTKPFALNLWHNFLFRKAQQSWKKSVSALALASASDSASPSASASQSNSKNNSTRTQIADIRAKRFQRSTASAAGADGGSGVANR